MGVTPAKKALAFALAIACVPIGSVPEIPPPPAPAPATGMGGATPVRPPDPPARDAAPAPSDPSTAPADSAMPESATTPPAPPRTGADTRPIVTATVSGFQLLVSRRNPDGSTSGPAPFDVRGISWSPAARGAGLPDDEAYLAAVDKDLPLMRAANINVVKTYLPVSRAVLDKLLAEGIVAIVTVLARAGDDVEGPVNRLRGHGALLMWMVGNEWNLNRLYDSCALDVCYERVNAAAARIKALDPTRAVATSFAPTGELPDDEDLRRLPAVEIWGLNIYSQPGFFQRFANWRAQATRTGIKKPFLLSEYGADAYDNRAGRPDEAAQAAALRRQTMEIRNQLSARNPAFGCLGGTPFEWNDEWWKRGDFGRQDAGGFANPGVAADQFANEEWWGVVDIDRKPRAAYHVLQELYTP